MNSQDITKFKELAKSKYGLELSDKQAEDQLGRMVSLLEMYFDFKKGKFDTKDPH